MRYQELQNYLDKESIARIRYRRILYSFKFKNSDIVIPYEGK